MQWLTTPFGPVPSVGGYTLQASGTPDTGFRFALRYDAVVTQTVSELFVFAGHGGTPGAIGLLHPHLRSGRLFRHEAPDASVPVVASTPDEFVRIAMEKHGQEVIHGGRPPGLDFLN